MIFYPGFSFKLISTPFRSFTINKKRTPQPRLGQLGTPHGKIETPNFIFCATKAAIKGMASHELSKLGTQIILANTYHLMLQPGADLIKEQGGLHRFMNWSGPMLTDSGGYQIFAMGFESVSKEIKRRSRSEVRKTLLKINSEGAWFQSYWNGDKVFLSPEVSIEVQRKLGADLIVQLDECTPFHIDKQTTERSMYLSLNWGKRSLKTFYRTKENYSPQAIYGVIQGGIYSDLRRISTSGVIGQGFFGIAIGGSLGSSRKEMYEVISLTCNEIYREFEEKGLNLPIHLLGIGKIPDIFIGVRLGIDTFDCVYPTRMARHGWAILPATVKRERNEEADIDSSSRINLNNSTFKHDDRSLDPSITIDCPGYFHYSRSYIHHLLKVKEISALTLLTHHNIFQMNRLMTDIRQGIKENHLDEVEKYWCGSLVHNQID